MPVYLNNKLIEPVKFPCGEVNVNVKDWYAISNTNNRYTLIYESDVDLFLLALVKNAVHHYVISEDIDRTSITEDLNMPYVPYSRQDRVCNAGEPLSVKVLADFINSLNFNRVEIRDPHSDVTPALFYNVVVEEQHKLVLDLLDLSKYTIVCPDAGAEKKIRKLGIPYLMCTKVRDPETGTIIKTKVDLSVKELEEEVTKEKYLIIDDICDGGKTFIEIAKEIKRIRESILTDVCVDLFVTHGFFTKGFDVFKGYIDNVYWIDPLTGNLHTREIIW